MAEKNEIYRNDWISIYKGFRKMNFRVAPTSYFDDRLYFSFSPTFFIPLIGIFFTGLSFWSLIWIPFMFLGYGQIYMHLPKYSGIDECEPPEYGFYFYGDQYTYFFDSFWLCLGEKKKCYNMPWQWDWVRTSVMLKNGSWEHDTYKQRKKGIRKDFYQDKWKGLKWVDSYPYTYILKNGKIQNRIATIEIEEMEWRFRTLKWFPLIKKKKKYIDVKFSFGGPFERFVIIEKPGNIRKNSQETGEIGERAGTYKGGITGCSYQIQKNETALQTLRRMEKERKF